MTRKVMNMGCMIALWMVVASCASTKNTPTLTSLDGEWNIIEINNTAVVPAPGQTFPFIAFNAETGQVYGNTGCNNLAGSIDKNAKAGIIDLSALGSTRMMCPDMNLEQQVLEALSKVKRYKQLNNENMMLTGSSKKEVIVLQKKQPTLTIADLKGKWMVTEAMGEAIPKGLEKQPYFEFDLAEMKLHGCAGCNFINGNVVVNDANPTAIAFPYMTRTMMTCPDIRIEDRIMKALNVVATFGELGGSGIGLYDASGKLVLVLAREEK